MKKSIKYAGIAAATLLTVAPVVGPVFNIVPTTVKAATPATHTDEEINTAIEHLMSSYKDTSFGTETSNVKTPYPNLMDDYPSTANSSTGFYGYGIYPKDSSFNKSSDASLRLIATSVERNLPGNILPEIGSSNLTATDIQVLRDMGDSGAYASTSVYDGDKELNLGNAWTSSPNYFNLLNRIKDVRDDGGSLKLKTTVYYKDSTGDKPADKEYTLTNNNYLVSDKDAVTDAVNDFSDKLTNVTNLRAGDNYPNLLLDMLGFYNSDMANWPGETIFRGYKNGSDDAFSSYDLFKKLSIGAAVGNISPQSEQAFIDNKINIKVGVEDADGKPVTDNAGLQDISDNNKPFKLTFGFEYPGKNGSIQSIRATKGVSFEPAQELTSVKATYNDTIHVKDGSNVSDVQAETSDFKFEGADGEESSATLTPNVRYGFYSSRDDAWITSKGMDDKHFDLSGTFDAKKGTKYYQIVQANVPDSFFTFMGNWMGDPSTYKLSLNGKELTVPNDYDDTTQTFANSSQIIFIREIVVGDTNTNNNNGSNNSAQTVSGIVTTHTDKNHYALYNDKNDKVDNRALMANSSWKVDGVRTVSGVKQYRVSTHEWVNASDVDFIENGQVTEGMTVKKLDTPKQIDLATRHSRYGLQNSKRETSKTRALAGGTSWLVDKVGTDMHGDVYYGVSTDEFVKAEDGVTLVK